MSPKIFKVIGLFLTLSNLISNVGIFNFFLISDNSNNNNFLRLSKVYKSRFKALSSGNSVIRFLVLFIMSSTSDNSL